MMKNMNCIILLLTALISFYSEADISLNGGNEGSQPGKQFSTLEVIRNHYQLSGKTFPSAWSQFDFQVFSELVNAIHFPLKARAFPPSSGTQAFFYITEQGYTTQSLTSVYEPQSILAQALQDIGVVNGLRSGGFHFRFAAVNSATGEPILSSEHIEMLKALLATVENILTKMVHKDSSQSDLQNWPYRLPWVGKKTIKAQLKTALFDFLNQNPEVSEALGQLVFTHLLTQYENRLSRAHNFKELIQTYYREQTQTSAVSVSPQGLFVYNSMGRPRGSVTIPVEVFQSPHVQTFMTFVNPANYDLLLDFFKKTIVATLFNEMIDYRGFTLDIDTSDISAIKYEGKELYNFFRPEFYPYETKSYFDHLKLFCNDIL